MNLGNETTTVADTGYFFIDDLRVGQMDITIAAVGYTQTQTTVELVAGANSLGEFLLHPNTQSGGSSPPTTEVSPLPLEWVPITGGTFQMGSDTSLQRNGPAHEVTVSDFDMLRAEVTVAQYEKCVDAGSCTAPSTHARTGRRATGKSPVAQITQSIASLGTKPLTIAFMSVGFCRLKRSGNMRPALVVHAARSRGGTRKQRATMP